MKITDVEAISLVIPIEGAIQPPISIPFPDKLTKVIYRDYRTTLVRVHTDEGVSGVGECMVRLAPTATRDIIECVKPILVGADPFDTEYMTSDWAKDQRNPLRSDRAELPASEVRDGHVVVSDRPGLGLVPNEEVLRKYRM